MNFEWDSRKRLINLHKHGLAFEDATLVFAGLMLVARDERRDYERTNYGEARYRALGVMEECVVVLIYTIRANTIRLISMRKANEKERQRYQERLAAFGRDDGRRH